METKISPKFSFIGFDIKTLLLNNKDNLKLIISAGFGLWLPTSPAGKVFAGAIMKLTLDSFDFFISKVTLK